MPAVADRLRSRATFEAGLAVAGQRSPSRPASGTAGDAASRTAGRPQDRVPEVDGVEELIAFRVVVKGREAHTLCCYARQSHRRCPAVRRSLPPRALDRAGEQGDRAVHPTRTEPRSTVMAATPDDEATLVSCPPRAPRPVRQF